MIKIVTFGEIMLRLSTRANTRILQTDDFYATYGGGEANVAVSLSNYGHDAFFVSKVPAHEIGQAAINSLRRYGVHTEYVSRGGNRLGVYYLETGASCRPSKVIYDRSYSSFSEATPQDFNFAEIFKGATWFHWSGITPALSDETAACLREALKVARQMGVTVSCDLNYRSKLWSPEKAQSVMRPLMEYVDVCIGNEEDAQMCLGFKPDADVQAGQTDADGYKNIFCQMQKEFGFRYVVSTLRESYSATRNGWKAMIFDGEQFCKSRCYDLNPIIDRVGAGDSFAAGIIHGIISGMSLPDTLEFAVSASALKHTIHGDVNLCSVEEVMALAKGNGNGRVVR